MSSLNIHQLILGWGGLYEDNSATLDYEVRNGVNYARKFISKEQFPLLADKFKKDPKEVLAFMRENVLATLRDPQQTPVSRSRRNEEYVQDFLNLQIILDRESFPPNENLILEGIPEYVPDRFSDLGRDPYVNPALRGREKILVDKRKIFDEFNDLLKKNLGSLPFDKKKVIEDIAREVYVKMPYDHSHFGGRLGLVTVPLSSVVRSPEPSAVCRHHALVTQVLLQSLGLTSRLLKCEIDGVSHAANLVRINNLWYLLDTTNPQSVEEVTLFGIPERHIDLNSRHYGWSNGRHNYRSRNNMFSRIK